jgi:CRISPR-associated endonuclease/helicase Cas3
MALVELLAGFCSVCDWVGSQTDFFPYETTPLGLDAWYAKALPRAEAAMAAAGFLTARPSGRSFSEIFPGLAPRDVQAVTEGLALPEGPSIVVVEARMGSGKTEAALSLAERWLSRGDATGLFVALPTMATSNGMFGRLVRCAGMMFEGDLNVRLAHSRSRSDETFRRLIERPLKLAGGRDAPDEREASLVCARWFLGRKRALLGQLGVGTVDQAMQAVITVRHHFVRAFGLATSVVIVDEVHAYDVYMEVILERLVEWLGALRTPVVLLSATLPAGRRRELVGAYRRGAGWPDAGPPEGAPAAVPYPLVTVGGPGGVASFTTDAPARPAVVSVEHCATDHPCRDVLPRLIEAARAGAMVAYVRNTVTDAQAAFDAAAGSGVGVRLFHARMRARDRAAVERDVLERFGPGGERRGALLIATQVVEQSLDLDFDLLATDLAPIDLVLQRAGRLHRHPRGRPPGFSSPALVLVTPTAGDLDALRFGGSEHVYDPATLWLAADSLAARGALCLPDDIRPLVEASYDPTSRSARLSSAPNADALLAAEARLVEGRARRELAARRCCIPPASFDAGALAVRDDDEEEVRALTRDGDSVTLLLVRWEDGEGYPLEAGGEPWALDAGAKGAWEVARGLFDETISVPAYPWERIERGARARGPAREWEDWSRRFEAFAADVRLGQAVVVPVRERDGVFRGRVETNRQQKAIAYTTARGLWFPKEGT